MLAGLCEWNSNGSGQNNCENIRCRDVQESMSVAWSQSFLLAHYQMYRLVETDCCTLGGLRCGRLSHF